MSETREHPNVTSLGRALGFTAKSVRTWQQTFEDAPRNYRENEWKAFLERHDLGAAGPRKSKRREELLVEKLASEIRLNEIKIAQAEAKLIPADEVDNFLLFLASRVKSAMFQTFATELPPKVAGLDVSEIRKIARESADVVCLSMQNALADFEREQEEKREAAAKIKA